MRKTNDELNALIEDQQASIAGAAGMVDVHRGHVSKSLGQSIKNRREAIRALEDQKEAETIILRSGL